ncbi:MAG: RNA pseudouridine synthase [Myxococcales bacterium]|nr:RNA pseudouridine synthase [Myxococcales bacterium]MCB9534118.1 RNA pseudouridine synthase [Myxococcales bacterium]
MPSRSRRAPSPRAPRPPPVTLGAPLYLDERAVVFDKPAGLPSDRTLDPNRDSAIAAAARWLAAAGLAADPLYLVHRLDRDTSGALLFARTREAARELGDAFAARDATKLYVALVSPPADLDELIDNHLAQVGERQAAVRAGGKRAVTRVATFARSPSATAVLAAPRTGRTHQIRVHLAERGHPILGDTTYGGSREAAGITVARCALHAWRLRVGPLAVAAPLPADMLALCVAAELDLGSLEEAAARLLL